MSDSAPDAATAPMTYEAFVAAAQRAALVRVVEGGQIDWRRRKVTPDVVRVDGQADIATLVQALRYEGPAGDNAWMQWPDLTFGFAAADREVLAELSYLRPGWLRHATWPGDQPLSNPDYVEAWLATHGWNPAA